jgi:hypothetical protein
MEGYGMSYGRPFAIWRDHPHLANFRQSLGERRQTRRVNSVIVGDQNTHGAVRNKKSCRWQLSVSVLGVEN